MTKLRLAPLPDDKPVRITLELLAGENATPADPARLIVPMLHHFITTDRSFAKARRDTAKRTPPL